MSENEAIMQNNDAGDSSKITIAAPSDAVDQLLLNLDGYEGPIDVLLEMSRNQKVDLAKISILQLVRQYLNFIERAKQYNLDLAAEYLVMAAWMAYLKSRLFLPKDETDDEPSAEDMAQALQFQLQRLEAMQNAAQKLSERPQLGENIFARGQPEGLDTKTITTWKVSLYDLLQAYGAIERRKEDSHYDLPEFRLMSTDRAMSSLTQMLGSLPKNGIHSVWATLHSFIPDPDDDIIYARSTLASTFTAGLELAKQGQLEFRQEGLFKPIYMRSCNGNAGDE